MYKKLGFVVLVLTLVGVACRVGIPSASVGGGGGVILFQDDFSDTGSGWDRMNGSDGLTDYASGGYRIHVTAPNWYLWANPGKTFQNDVRIEVDTAKAGGPDNNDFGVICRYQSIGNFFYFLISSDGYAVIGMVKDGEQVNLSSDQMELTGAIRQGADTNHIRADCIGNRLTLYVNGQQVASATDTTFTGGDVGLIAGTYNEVGTDILFDNFVVYKP